MTIFDILKLLGGLALFLFGMKVMGDALEKRAGNQLKAILAKLTSNLFNGFLLGLGVTVIIQSSSATTVMVVGFVNSGLMTLHQATGVIMGANLGTSVTAWLLSTTGISGGVWYLDLVKPSSFTPLLAFIGILLFMFQKNIKKRDIGLIFLGFAVLMTGMEIMSGAVDPLKDSPEFRSVLVTFSNPIIGILVGTVFTAIIQSSSASVGILQVLSMTGAVSFGTAIPIVIGQNIGTCISAMISSIGASKNARRASLVHLYFNILAALIIMPLVYIVNSFVGFDFAKTVNPITIAVLHTAFKLLALVLLMPASRFLEKLATLTVPDKKDENDTNQILDDRFLATPAVAIERAREVAVDMAELASNTIKSSLSLLTKYDEKVVANVLEGENRVDKFEDMLGTYLVKISANQSSSKESKEVTKLLHIIGDYERISDHAVNIVQSAEEMHDKKLAFSDEAYDECMIFSSAVSEILDSALKAFKDGNMDAAFSVEPLEEVVDRLNSKLKNRHIARLKNGECTIELGFVFSDILTNLERVSDHCSNIAGCVIEIEHDALDLHEYFEKLKSEANPLYMEAYNNYKQKYALSKSNRT